MKTISPIQVGSQVIAKRASGVCDPGERGICYETYVLNGRPGWSFIFASGRYDGFSPTDVATFLEVTGEVCQEVADYHFTNVGQLCRDFQQVGSTQGFTWNPPPVRIPVMTATVPASLPGKATNPPRLITNSFPTPGPDRAFYFLECIPMATTLSCSPMPSTTAAAHHRHAASGDGLRRSQKLDSLRE